tara:strand:+ start:215 stop:634 length:420 start_codon:yes stop_codon:yes gene_type:complete
MKIYNWFILILLFFEMGCNSRLVKPEIELLNGYWRIDFISQKNETFRPEGITKLLDYYSLEKNIGVRKKVEPLINNNFIITEDRNPFRIVYNGKDYFLQFETRWDQWREKIIKLNKSELVLEHQEKKYHYIRFVKDLEL